MPTIGSETYHSREPLETRDKNTYPSRVPAESIPGPDYPVISTISELVPSELPVSDPDTEMTITGTNFNEQTVVVWNGGDEVTEFVDAEHVKTLVKPSTVTVEPPFNLPVSVRNGEISSNTLSFTFTPEDAPETRKKNEPKPNPEDEKNAPKHPYPNHKKNEPEHVKVQPKHRR